jgi:hypothetical protein
MAIAGEPTRIDPQPSSSAALEAGDLSAELNGAAKRHEVARSSRARIR